MWVSTLYSVMPVFFIQGVLISFSHISHHTLQSSDTLWIHQNIDQNKVPTEDVAQIGKALKLQHSQSYFQCLNVQQNHFRCHSNSPSAAISNLVITGHGQDFLCSHFHLVISDVFLWLLECSARAELLLRVMWTKSRKSRFCQKLCWHQKCEMTHDETSGTHISKNIQAPGLLYFPQYKLLYFACNCS